MDNRLISVKVHLSPTQRIHKPPDPLCATFTPYNTAFAARMVGHHIRNAISSRPMKAAMDDAPTAARNLIASAVLIIVVGIGLNIGASRLGSEEPPRNQSDAERLAKDALILRDWDIPEQGMFDEHGKISVQKNELHLAEGVPATGIRFNREVPRTDYEIRCEAKRTGGSDFFYGLTFPVGQDYCSWIVGGWGGTAVGLSNLDGLSAIENSTTQYMEIEKNRWYKTRLRVADGKITGWIDGKTIFEVAIKDHTFDIWWEQTPLRPLGIATWNTSAALRNFKLIKLKPVAQQR